MDATLVSLTQTIGQLLILQHKKIVVAESCTGGWIAQTLTALAGSSQWFDRGYVCYSNAAKTDMLGVTASLIEKYGAVSAETAEAMAAGALRASGAQFSLAVTGIAGPDGGSKTKPVGTVWFGFAYGQEVITEHYLFEGDRTAIRKTAVIKGLEQLHRLVAKEGRGG